MANYDCIQERRSSVWTQASTKRVSWGAIMAGAMVAILSQLLLSLLGMGIGLVTVNPATESNPFAGLGIGAAIWWCASMLVSLYLGGYVAGQMAGIPRKGDGFLHGFLSWGVVTLTSVLLLTTAVGKVVGGVGSLMGNITGTTVQAGAQAAAEQPEQAKQAMSPENLKQQASQIVQQAKQEMQEANVGDAEGQARQTGEKAAEATGAASFGTFALLLLGALTSGFGGRSGAPKALYAGPIRREASAEVERTPVAAGR